MPKKSSRSISFSSTSSLDSVTAIFGKTVQIKPRKITGRKNESQLFASDAYQTQIITSIKPKYRGGLKNSSSIGEGLCWNIDDYKPGK